MPGGRGGGPGGYAQVENTEGGGFKYAKLRHPSDGPPKKKSLH